jgi:hypothetical protein
MVCEPITALVDLAARAAARRMRSSIGVMPSSPALILIQAATTPVSPTPSVNSPSIQASSSSPLALPTHSGIHGSR